MIIELLILIIGIAMIGQTKRDAQIIRHILKLEKQELDHLQDILESNEKDENGNWVENELYRGDYLLGSPQAEKKPKTLIA